jgi:hypothetical protein
MCTECSLAWQDFALKRLRDAFQRAFGDLDSQWPLKPAKVADFLHQVLNPKP